MGPALTPVPASTVVLLRDAAEGVQVFMVQRHRNSGFMPSAWVFPGGRVDPGDALSGHPGVRGGGRACAAMGMSVQAGVPYLVAAVRETFEEAGLWLGDGEVPASERGPLARSERSLVELLDATGAVLDLDRLAPWAWWITPKVEPRRFDTRFLVARASGEGRHDAHETVDSGWFTVAELLSGAQSGRFPMAPPTWWTLRELADLPTVDAVLAAAPARPGRPIEPILSITPGPSGSVAADVRLLLPGHPEHPEPAIPGLPAEVRYLQGRWWADGHVAPEFSNRPRD